MPKRNLNLLPSATMAICLAILLAAILISFFVVQASPASPDTPGPSPTATMTLIPANQGGTPSPPASRAMDTPGIPIPLDITATLMVTPSLTVTPTATLTPTVTASPTPSLTPWPTPERLPFLSLPLIFRQPTPTLVPVPPELVLVCSQLGTPLSIPDNWSPGVVNNLTSGDYRQITDLDVYLDIDHDWVGDLTTTLAHADTGTRVVLLDRPGYPASTTGCGNDDVRTILDDHFSALAENKCSPGPAAIAGIYLPAERLTAFNGELLGGTWTLNVADNFPNDTGRLKRWCLAADVSVAPPAPTPTPVIPGLPSRYIISGVTGQSQAMPLDCETRSAVDWAHYMGVSINEYTFFNQLPKSANPDKGFVGNVWGTWGQIPPNDYGIHEEPVANLLQAYGLPAYAHRELTWNELRYEIASARPVIVWIIGSTISKIPTYGAPVYFTPPDGLHTVVARYEHTVVVTGYSESEVYFLNGGGIYTMSITAFLDSWSALGNRAITTRP